MTASIVARDIELSEASLDKESVYWMETRPERHGRRTIVMNRERNEDITSAQFDVGTRVYEYGGGSYAAKDGTIYFSNFDDMKIYKVQTGVQSAQPITTNTSEFRHGDLTVDRKRNCLFCIREEHRGEHNPVLNSIVTISLADPSTGTTVESGNDFYLSPKLSPDGSTLSWITWNFPNMPWDATEIWKAEVTKNGTVTRKAKIAGGAQESVIQPEWGPDGALYFISDRTGWWNIFRYRDGRVENMHLAKVDFGEPQWHLGMSTYAVTARNLICKYIRNGYHKLATIDLETEKFENLPLPFTSISGIRAEGENAVFCASSSFHPTSIVRLNLTTREWKILRMSSERSIDASYFSNPREIEFPTKRGRTAHAFYYPPKNPEYRAAKDEKPPLLVKVHGGPTGVTAASFDLQIQFFTTRGFAVLDVNYGGSTGYGRKYRERLNCNWGVIDVEDCARGAKFLCDSGKSDRKRLLIRGGSAGGFTTLASLAFTKLYKAGACYYGISDLEAWARDTHKFESRYLDKMIGPYPAQRKLYLKRSPARSATKISVPLIILQGLDDKVVPPSQSELMVKQMRKKKLQVKYLTFDDEGHGFHAEEHVRKALESELNLYSKTLGIKMDYAQHES